MNETISIKILGGIFWQTPWPSPLVIFAFTLVPYYCPLYLTTPRGYRHTTINVPSFYPSFSLAPPFFQRYKLFKNKGWGYPKKGKQFFNIFSPNSHLLVGIPITTNLSNNSYGIARDITNTKMSGSGAALKGYKFLHVFT